MEFICWILFANLIVLSFFVALLFKFLGLITKTPKTKKKPSKKRRVIYHITPLADWVNSGSGINYKNKTLETEGFIHCSTPKQILKTAEKYKTHWDKLVLLEIDVEKVRTIIKFESGDNKEFFPHIYGPINLDAITRDITFDHYSPEKIPTLLKNKKEAKKH